LEKDFGEKESQEFRETCKTLYPLSAYFNPPKEEEGESSAPPPTEEKEGEGAPEGDKKSWFELFLNDPRV
jgi:hypothetical protein